MVMDTLLYGGVTALLTYSALRETHKISQYISYDKKYGQKPNITLTDLVEQAERTNQELPSFKIFVPAYKEADVIEATIRNLVKSNYPSTHFEINVITHADEPYETEEDSTTKIVEKTADEINYIVGYDLVKNTVVPESYEGFFPQRDDRTGVHMGKPRSLNYAIRQTHVENERDERSYFIGKMLTTGEAERADNILHQLELNIKNKPELERIVQNCFSSNSDFYLSSLATSSQLETLFEIYRDITSNEIVSKKFRRLLEFYIEKQSGKFYLEFNRLNNGKGSGDALLEPMENKLFLRDTMLEIENKNVSDLRAYVSQREDLLKVTRPVLHHKLEQAESADEIYQISKKLNSRWMIVYDADADAPRDVMRYYAASILTDDEVMAFQGPVAPIGNTEEVTSLPRMAGFQFGFNHITHYPRLLHKDKWAHPLAGTNWCLRLEGMVEDDTLVRDIPYDESKREFLTYFKPEALTEDLELGLRLFSERKINARWHPYIEIEQVPPDAKALRKQRVRWAEGTLALLDEIWDMEIPLSQKLHYSLYPLNSVVTAATPIACGAYMTAILAGAYEIDPIYGALPIMLAASNLLYSFEFTLPYFKLQEHVEQNNPYDEMYNVGKNIHERLSSGRKISEESLSMLEETVNNLKRGLGSKGFIRRYTENRITDESAEDFDTKIYDFEFVEESTHQIPSLGQFQNLVDLLDSDISNIESIDNIEYDDGLHNKIEEVYEISALNQRDKWDNVKRILEFVALTIPYTFHDAYMPLKALFKKVTGKAAKEWDKTPRTVKNFLTTSS